MTMTPTAPQNVHAARERVAEAQAQLRRIESALEVWETTPNVSPEAADRIKWFIAAIVTVLAVLIAVALWRKQRSQAKRPPRAKASWLRRFRTTRHSPL